EPRKRPHGGPSNRPRYWAVPAELRRMIVARAFVSDPTSRWRHSVRQLDQPFDAQALERVRHQTHGARETLGFDDVAVTQTALDPALDHHLAMPSSQLPRLDLEPR